MLLRISNSLTVWGWYRICLLDFSFSLCLSQPDLFSFHFISICSAHRSQISLKSASIPLFPWIRYFTISLSLLLRIQFHFTIESLHLLRQHACLDHCPTTKSLCIFSLKGKEKDWEILLHANTNNLLLASSFSATEMDEPEKSFFEDMYVYLNKCMSTAPKCLSREHIQTF